MASIQTYLNRILSSRYGKDVRQSIHDAIEELNAVAVTAQGSASKSAQTASDKATEANASKEAAAKSASTAEAAANRAVAVSGVGVASETVAGLMAGGDNMVDDSGALVLTRKTTDRTLTGSKDSGGVKINYIAGESQQDSEPTPDVPQDIESSIVGKIKVVWKNLLLPHFVSLNRTVSGVTFTNNGDGSIHVKGTSTAIINFAIVGMVARKLIL